MRLGALDQGWGVQKNSSGESEQSKGGYTKSLLNIGSYDTSGNYGARGRADSQIRRLVTLLTPTIEQITVAYKVFSTP